MEMYLHSPCMPSCREEEQRYLHLIPINEFSIVRITDSIVKRTSSHSDINRR